MYGRDGVRKKKDPSIMVSAYTAMTAQHDGRKEGWRAGRKTDNDDIVIFQYEVLQSSKRIELATDGLNTSRNCSRLYTFRGPCLIKKKNTFKRTR